MGLKDLFRDKNHKTPELPPNLDVGGEGEVGGPTDETPEPEDHYEAHITGNAVDGYDYNIYVGDYHYEYSEAIYNKRSLAAVEEAARKHLAAIRKREATKLSKVIK